MYMKAYEVGAYAGGGCTGCTCTLTTWEESSAQKRPKEERKFRPDMSAKKESALTYDKINAKKRGKRRKELLI